ncbi:MAG: glycosyl transferase family 28 [Flavisolibacter sp.]|nr:glycosyl transferase family 28 [Flavisolibacter sp.]
MNPTTATVGPRILVAPLDWGLGHATRCIPVINALLAAGCEVVLAGEGKTEHLLRTEFPQLLFLPLNGYQVHYGKTRFSLILNLLQQVPRIIHTIKYEHYWLKEVVIKYGLNAVITDNRYGLYNRSIYSVFITHQLTIKTPFGKWVEAALQLLNYRYINRFNACWIPDEEKDGALAGALSHPKQKPAIPIHYIGVLSRFVRRWPPATPAHLLLLLSGPEPQRTLWEKQLMAELTQYQKPVLLVRGLPGSADSMAAPPYVTALNHLPADSLQEAIEKASFVIARCGYSTVMDLMTLQKKSILIPTPGQSEQEYLAGYLMEKQIAFCVPQHKFRLLPALELAVSFPYQFNVIGNIISLQTIVQQLAKNLSQERANVFS